MNHIYVYATNFYPPSIRTLFTRRFLFAYVKQELSKYFDCYILTGMNLFSPKDHGQTPMMVPLTNEKFKEAVVRSEEGVVKEKIQMTLTKVREISLENIIKAAEDPNKAQTALTFLNLIIKRLLSECGMYPVGRTRKYLLPSAAKRVETYPIEVWPGYYTSVNFYEDGLLLEIDYASRILRLESVHDFIQFAKRNTREWVNVVRKEIANKSVIARYGSRRTYVINDLVVDRNPVNTKLDSESITLYEYYKKRYFCLIKDKYQPLLLSIRKDKNGNDTRVYLIPELCSLTGLPERLRADRATLQKLSIYTKLSPDQRKLEAEVLLRSFVSTVESEAKANSYMCDEAEMLAEKPYKSQENSKEHERAKLMKGKVVMEEEKKRMSKVVRDPSDGAQNISLYESSIADPKNAISFNTPKEAGAADSKSSISLNFSKESSNYNKPLEDSDKWLDESLQDIIKIKPKADSRANEDESIAKAPKEKQTSTTDHTNPANRNNEKEDKNGEELVEEEKNADVLEREDFGEIRLDPDVDMLTLSEISARKTSSDIGFGDSILSLAEQFSPEPKDEAAFTISQGRMIGEDRLRKTETILKKWNLTVSFRPHEIKGRILENQEITLHNKKSLRVADSGQFFFKEPIALPINITNWIIVYSYTDERTVGDFIESLYTSAKTFGIRVGSPYEAQANSGDADDFIYALKVGLNNVSSPQIVVFLLTTGSPDDYAVLKQFSLAQKPPLFTQMVRSQTIQSRKNRLSVCTKIALQMNVKINAILWKVKMPASLPRKTMIVGIDSSNEGGFSCLGMSSTYDPSFCKYYTQVIPIRERKIPKEAFGRLIRNALERFKKEAKAFLPELIVIYRDGLCENNKTETSQEELNGILESISRNYANYRPELLYALIHKKIHTRFFMKLSDKISMGYSVREDRGKNLVNPHPGTIVDTGIVDPTAYEFLIMPQYVNEGSGTPSRINVLHNNTAMSLTTFEELTSALCYGYYNWQGAIRAPAPCKYAFTYAKFVAKYVKAQICNEIQSFLHFL
eukprot:TRINITY_DN6417_c0_g2_i2.p1 TRINITY_DN6417_c0_g2~~TRINITY_DN6417_c0_g2_i2.p1  ORF type:complete len:1027 (-),score=347.90 TRINITY_DN6417_c0_g2_i2:155-3235(-)